MQHPSHYVIEQLGATLQQYEHALAEAHAEIKRLSDLVEAPAVPVEQPDS